METDVTKEGLLVEAPPEDAYRSIGVMVARLRHCDGRKYGGSIPLYSTKDFIIHLNLITVMKNTILHFKKLLPAAQFIVTGSYSLAVFGLMKHVKDLDIIIHGPTEETLSILKRMREPGRNPNYPPDENQFRVKYEDIHIDFFLQCQPQAALTIDGIDYAYPADTAQAKRRYKSVKHLLQLKSISELFFRPQHLEEALRREQNRLEKAGTYVFKPEIKTIDIDIAATEASLVSRAPANVRGPYEYANPKKYKTLPDDDDYDDYDDGVEPAPYRKPKPAKQ